MKKVFTNPSVIPCDLICAFLRGCEIECMIKNEWGSGMAGEGWPVPGNPTLAWAWPEVWVNDDQFEDALGIVATFQESESNDENAGIQPDNQV